jgi:putative flippase GtrA
MRPTAPTQSAAAAPRPPLASRLPLAKLARFAAIGLASGTIYALVTSLLVSGLDWGPIFSSIVGYCVSVPASFIGHRRFSFRSRGLWRVEALRFVATQALNIAVTAGAMFAATAWLGSHYGWGMLAAVILVPIANFLVMNLWVFRDQAR